jgi:hypothetical protein
LGGAKILDGNIHPLFDHQTVLENGREGNIQTANNDFQTKINVRKTISGIDAIVPIAQCGSITGLDTLPGEIKITGYSPIPTVLPLCVSSETVLDWSISVEVMGGYTPEDGQIKVNQGKGVPCTPEGYIDYHWTCSNPEASCCVAKLWTASFSVVNDFCLDSNQYPIILDETGADISDEFCWKYPKDANHEPLTEIPGKEVDLQTCFTWSGCPLDEQEFALISVRNNHQFPK